MSWFPGGVTGGLSNLTTNLSSYAQGVLAQAGQAANEYNTSSSSNKKNEGDSK